MKLFYSKVFFSLLLFHFVLSAKPQNDLIPEHETFVLQSQKVGEARTINVWMPPEYKTNAEALPVLYMLDGGIKEDFPHVANTLAELIQAKKIKPIVLVGIENTQRRRDLTGPTNVKKDKKIAPVVGGSEQFRSFISEELFAEIMKRYRTTNRKGIIGESLAGLFVTETFLLKPDLFDFYIAFDPSLWWNNKSLTKSANTYLDQFSNQPKVFWFAASDAKDIYKTVDKLSDKLKSKKVANIKWYYLRAKQETHATIFRATKVEALVWTLNNAMIF